MNLIIAGAGGMGREVFSWLNNDIDRKKGFHIKGFIDDNLNALDDLDYPVGVIGTIADYKPSANDSLVLAILNPKIKRRIAETLVDRGASFYTLVHPSAILGFNVKLGMGDIICPNCILTNDIQVGDFVFINTSSTLGHDVTIGDYTSINGKVEITGNVEVGPCCFFGVGAKVIPGRKIGENATVGAGSVVIRNVPANTTVFGNPAKKI
jgi:sugar O-acyltransferase (sialic acid O-acetyltransferase NeuD family)